MKVSTEIIRYQHFFDQESTHLKYVFAILQGRIDLQMKISFAKESASANGGKNKWILKEQWNQSMHIIKSAGGT